MTTALEPTKQFETKREDIIETAARLEIKTAADAQAAASLGRQIRDLKREILDYWNDKKGGPVALAHAAWKATVAKRDAMVAPLDIADTAVCRELVKWDGDQRQKAAELQRLAAEAARKEREAEIRRQAEEAKKAGAKAAEVQALRNQMRAEPIIAPVVTPPPTPKGLSIPETWQAECDDLGALVRAIAKPGSMIPFNILRVDYVALNAFARATQGQVSVPGVRFFKKNQVRYR